MPNIETRKVKLELRTASEDKPKIIGMPIVYNKRSEDMGFFEINAIDSAKNAIETSDIRALYGHNSDSILPLGRQSANTLQLKNTPEGVIVEINPPDTQFVRDLMISIARGDVSEMSYAFRVHDDSWDRVDGADIRTIHEIKEIFDVSIVVFPAFNDTKVALRSRDLYNQKHKNVHNFNDIYEDLLIDQIKTERNL